LLKAVKTNRIAFMGSPMGSRAMGSGFVAAGFPCGVEPHMETDVAVARLHLNLQAARIPRGNAQIVEESPKPLRHCWRGFGRFRCLWFRGHGGDSKGEHGCKRCRLAS